MVGKPSVCPWLHPSWNIQKSKKMYLSIRLIMMILILCIARPIQAQDENKIPEIRFAFNESGTHYIRFTGLNQVWIRHTDLNPGSTVYGSPISSMDDIGIR